MSNLNVLFSALSPNEKAMFLGRVAHMATVAAREAYVQDYDHPDGIILREANEFVHRVTGYIGPVLDSSEGEGQDASVMAMIEEYFQTHCLQRHLLDWLGTSN